MKIGIIGAGQIGATLVRQYSKAGHRLKMTNSSGIEKLRGLALETGASAVTLSDAIIDVEVVVIAIPLIAILKLPKQLFKNASANTIIVDTSRGSWGHHSRQLKRMTQPCLAAWLQFYSS